MTLSRRSTSMAGPDAADPYSRARPLGRSRDCRQHCGSACRAPGSAIFFGDRGVGAAYERGARSVSPRSARASSRSTSSRSSRRRACSTKGPGWRSAISRSQRSASPRRPNAMHPVTREIIARGARPTRRRRLCGVLPARGAARACATASSPHRRAGAADRADRLHGRRVLADPIQLNSRLGTYTNFVNLLDLCGLAVPASMRPRRHAVRHHAAGAGRAGCALASIGRAFHADTGLPLGAHGSCAAARLRRCRRVPAATKSRSRSSARICPACRSTANCARSARASGGDRDRAGLSALCARGTQPPKPGLLRVATARAPRSRSKSGRCRPRASAASSPRCRRRCRSAR